MYTKGLLKTIEPFCDKMEKDFISCQEYHEDGSIHVHGIHDSDGSGEWLPPCVYLPHACDEWVIGGPDQVRELISDLQDALKEME